MLSPTNATRERDQGPEDESGRRGQRAYRGYIADMMDKLAEVVGFRYEIFVNEENTYGYRKYDGTWDGMIGDVLNKVLTIGGMGGDRERDCTGGSSSTSMRKKGCW